MKHSMMIMKIEIQRFWMLNPVSDLITDLSIVNTEQGFTNIKECCRIFKGLNTASADNFCICPDLSFVRFLISAGSSHKFCQSDEMHSEADVFGEKQLHEAQPQTSSVTIMDVEALQAEGADAALWPSSDEFGLRDVLMVFL